MSFDVTATLRSIESKLLSSGYFKHVQIGEPKGPAEQRFTAAIFMSDVSRADLPLAEVNHVYTVLVRIYDDMLREPQEDVEIEMSNVLDKFLNDLCGEFDLGATIRHVDVGGIWGTALGAKWGYIDLNNWMYRVVDVTVPLVVNTAIPLAA